MNKFRWSDLFSECSGLLITLPLCGLAVYYKAEVLAFLVSWGVPV